MKQFDYMEKWKKLLTPQIVSYLTTIHEYCCHYTHKHSPYPKYSCIKLSKSICVSSNAF